MEHVGEPQLLWVLIKDLFLLFKGFALSRVCPREHLPDTGLHQCANVRGGSARANGIGPSPASCAVMAALMVIVLGDGLAR